MWNAEFQWERGVFHLLNHSPSGHDGRSWGEPKAAVRNSTVVSPVDGRDPNTWTILLYHPRFISRSRTARIWTETYMGCQGCRQQLRLLHHKASRSECSRTFSHVGFQHDYLMMLTGRLAGGSSPLHSIILLSRLSFCEAEEPLPMLAHPEVGLAVFCHLGSRTCVSDARREAWFPPGFLWLLPVFKEWTRGTNSLSAFIFPCFWLTSFLFVQFNLFFLFKD